MSIIKRIIVGGAGGTPSLNFIRSLRMTSERFFLIGITCNKYDLYKAKKYVDCAFLVPPAKEREYLPVLKDIISETRPDFMHAQNDQEVNVISRHRDELGIKVFLPRHEIVEICQDKFESAKLWKKAGLVVPKTFMIKNEKDLEKAFAEIRGKLWIRAVSGAAGKWSLPTDNFDLAKLWIEHHKGWGEFTAAECLGSESVTWLSVWKNGELVVAQGRKRLYWEFADRSVSGITGITGTGVTVSDREIDSLATKAIKAIDPAPHGIFGVDFTYDKNGVANPTEINIGRFFTTTQFFSEAGLNMPHIYVKLAFDEVPNLKTKLNPLKQGLAWIRGMDVEPILTSLDEIEKLESDLKTRIEKINRRRRNA
ncbi:MAG: carboxylate--amine ligase [Promethearchaeota archaeon]